MNERDLEARERLMGVVAAEDWNTETVASS